MEKAHIKDYVKLPKRNKETIDGTPIKSCEQCGGRCYMFYEEERKYRAECEKCGDEVEFKHNSLHEAINHFNSILHEEYDCEYCPLGWEDRSYEGECSDCGCLVNEDVEWCKKTFSQRLEKSKEFDEQ